MARLVLALAVALVLALGITACGGDDEPSADGGTTAAQERDPAPASEADPTGCEPVAEPAPGEEGHLRKPALRLARNATWVATVTTNCGDFEITLDTKRAPKTAASFTALAREGFYNGLVFHRVVEGFVIQGGDPTGVGSGGPGYTVVEPPPRRLAYTKGVVAMAKTPSDPPGASGSQFFVVTGEDAQLPPEYALLGKVTQGLDTVERIGVVPVDAGDRPVEPVVIRQVTVERR